MDNKTVKWLSIAALVIAVGGLTMGYAALSQTLNVNTSATVQSQATTWDVHFENQGEGTATGHAEKGSISLDTTTVTVSGVILKVAGDSVEYTFDVKNGGQVNAKISTLTPKEPVVSGSGSNQTNVQSGYEYKLTYSDSGTEVKQNDTLNAGETKTLKLKISLKPDANLPSEDITITGLGYTIVYVQA